MPEGQPTPNFPERRMVYRPQVRGGSPDSKLSEGPVDVSRPKPTDKYPTVYHPSPTPPKTPENKRAVYIPEVQKDLDVELELKDRLIEQSIEHVTLRLELDQVKRALSRLEGRSESLKTRLEDTKMELEKKSALNETLARKLEAEKAVFRSLTFFSALVATSAIGLNGYVAAQRVSSALERGERIENAGDVIDTILRTDPGLHPEVVKQLLLNTSGLENARFEVRKELMDARFDQAAEMLENSAELKREFGRGEISDLAEFVEGYDIVDFWHSVEEKSELDLDMVSAHFKLRGVGFYSDSTVDQAVQRYEAMVQTGELRTWGLEPGDTIEEEFSHPAGLYAQGFVFINLSNVDTQNGLVAGVDDVLKHELMHGFFGYGNQYLNEGMTEWTANQLHAESFPEHNSHAGYVYGREMTSALIAEVIDDDKLVWQSFIRNDYQTLEQAFDKNAGVAGTLSSALGAYVPTPRLGAVDNTYLQNEMKPLIRIVDTLGARAEDYVTRVNNGRPLDSGRLLLIREDHVRGALITAPETETGILNGSLIVSFPNGQSSTRLTLGDRSDIAGWAGGRRTVGMETTEGVEFTVRPNIWTELGGRRSQARGDELFSSEETLRGAVQRLVEVDE